MQRGQHDDAFREVKMAVQENAAAAGADPALGDAAAKSLGADGLELAVGAFKGNERFVAALADEAVQAATTEQRHLAHDGLRLLGQESRGDLVAMWILDLEDAQRCPTMRSVWKRLRATDDPRVQALKNDLRKRGRNDRHLRCLKRQLR
jgi:hypothetical protein